MADATRICRCGGLSHMVRESCPPVADETNAGGLTSAEKKSLHPAAGNWAAFYAAVERIVAEREQGRDARQQLAETNAGGLSDAEREWLWTAHTVKGPHFNRIIAAVERIVSEREAARDAAWAALFLRDGTRRLMAQEYLMDRSDYHGQDLTRYAQAMAAAVRAVLGRTDHGTALDAVKVKAAQEALQEAADECGTTSVRLWLRARADRLTTDTP